MKKLANGRNLSSTLDSTHIKFNLRRSGNTTRLVDSAINLLFKGDVVICQDHNDTGRNTRSNQDLFRRVVSRLNNEHKGFVERTQLSKSLSLLYLIPPDCEDIVGYHENIKNEVRLILSE